MTLPTLIDSFTAAPFNLDGEAVDWVRRTHAALDDDAMLGQIVLPANWDLSTDGFDAMLAQKVGGIHRPASASASLLRASTAYLQARSAVPLLLSTDIEFSEAASLSSGTAFPNEIAVAATGDPIWAGRMGLVAAREGAWHGFNWSFTPVADLDLNFRNPAVNTRSFGSDPDTAAVFARAYVEAMQREHFAAGAKHWPGDGVDERDQHFVTSVNSLAMDEWRARYGTVFRAVIAAGVKTIMSGHITLPAYTAELGGKNRSPGSLPASLNADLNPGLLRGEFGFNGLIISDAAGMAGFATRGRWDDLIVTSIANGCDILLFPNNVATDLATLKRGLADGRLTRERLGEAVMRVLALKASLGLHQSVEVPPPGERDRWKDEHAAWARGVAEAGITLVRDEQHLLPLTPEKHRRLLVLQLPKRRSASREFPPLTIADRLRDRGFDVTVYAPGKPIETEAQDAALYLLADEGGSAKLFLHAHWEELHGMFPASMTRLWHKLPTAIVSLGTPYHLYEAPDCMTYINAWSPVPVMQEAVVEALTGKIGFNGKSPVDPFAGLEVTVARS